MKKGHSGASLIVTVKGVMKSGKKGSGILAQAELCKLLYPVTPKIIGTWSTKRGEAYAMEILAEPAVFGLFESELFDRVDERSNWVARTIEDMRSLLCGGVWKYRAEDSIAWIEELRCWLRARMSRS